MEPTSKIEEPASSTADQTEFKKPVLVGRVGKLPRKAKVESAPSENSNKTSQDSEQNTKDTIPENVNNTSSLPPAVLLKELSTPIPYKEPKWSGLCPDGTGYALEVLKSGQIVERVNLSKKPYYVFGRLANCDIVMAHPTISRHHAILQYKAFAEGDEPSSGWYLYDLGSTHGTFLNKDRLKAAHFTRVRVGHQIKFGNSTRTYIMLGPDFDSEGESELTVTEIKQKSQEMKMDRERMIKEVIEQREINKLEMEKKREEQGIDWGMGEDAEEEPDLADNPYASTANEELYLQDPKKTLRGYFEREGHELKYDCEERGIGQFICRVELPLDDARGQPVVAEVIHRGKKKEAVVAAALEACRVLDRAGLLRQAKHESRRRKQRDWSADDYYDSDEDTFLDRTGAVERKRDSRMKRHGAPGADSGGAAGPLTYQDLVKQVSEIEGKIAVEEKGLARLRAAGKKSQDVATEEGDALDQFMSSLGKQGQTMAQKAEISQTKMNIQKLKTQLSKTQRLAEIARPADMPPLIKKKDTSKLTVKIGSNAVVYGKRIRLKDDDKRVKVRAVKKEEETEFVEEVDSDEEDSMKKSRKGNVEDEHSGVNKDDGTVRNEDSKTNNEMEVHIESEESETKRVFGPMRPPDNYVIPDGYFEQHSDRDLPEIIKDE